jgi:caa(3)-type oxidase subunit IV
MASHAEDIQKHVRTYMMVFASLGVLTIVTVAVSYLHLSTPAAVAVALAVALVKGSLVALYFMHLIAEEKTIYWLLGLTAAFFVTVMFIPTGWYENSVVVNSVWDKLPAEGNTAHTSGAHGGAAGHGDEAGHAAAKEHADHAGEAGGGH